MSYFGESEFWCKCGRAECDAPRVVNPKLLEQLNKLRELYGKPIVIVSGLRCGYWNWKKGGTSDSGHPDGDEVDVACATSRDRNDLLKLVYKNDLFCRIGIGPGFLHLGVSERLTQDVCWDYYPKGRTA